MNNNATQQSATYLYPIQKQISFVCEMNINMSFKGLRPVMKFVPKGPIDNTSALVHVIDWHRTDNKPLTKTMLTQLPVIGMEITMTHARIRYVHKITWRRAYVA